MTEDCRKDDQPGQQTVPIASAACIAVGLARDSERRLTFLAPELLGALIDDESKALERLGGKRWSAMMSGVRERAWQARSGRTLKNCEARRRGSASELGGERRACSTRLGA